MILLVCNIKTEILQLSQPSPYSLYLRSQFNRVFAGKANFYTIFQKHKFCQSRHKINRLKIPAKSPNAKGSAPQTPQTSPNCRFLAMRLAIAIYG